MTAVEVGRAGDEVVNELRMGEDSLLDQWINSREHICVIQGLVRLTV